MSSFGVAERESVVHLPTSRSTSATFAGTNVQGSQLSCQDQRQQCSRSGQKRQFACMYTMQKTQKHKKWHDGRLLFNATAVSLFAADPMPGSGAPVLDHRELSHEEASSIAEGSCMELEKHLVTVEGAWLGVAKKGAPPIKSTLSTGMQRILKTKYRRPATKLPPLMSSIPKEICRKRPLQPGELSRQFYGDPENVQHGHPQLARTDDYHSSSQHEDSHRHAVEGFENADPWLGTTTTRNKTPQQHGHPQRPRTHEYHRTSQHEQSHRHDVEDFPARNEAALHFMNHQQQRESSEEPQNFERSPNQNNVPDRNTVILQPNEDFHSTFQSRPSSELRQLPRIAQASIPSELHNARAPAPPRQIGFVENEFNASSFYGEDLDDDEETEEDQPDSSPVNFHSNQGPFPKEAPSEAKTSGTLSNDQLLDLFNQQNTEKDNFVLPLQEASSNDEDSSQ